MSKKYKDPIEEFIEIKKEKNYKDEVNISNKTTFIQELKEWTKTIFVALIIFLIINVFIVNVKVEGLSMYPTYNENDFLIVNKIAYKKDNPDFGDNIVFETSTQGHLLIKRVIGLPNDKIVIKDNRVYRNDSLLNEEYIKDGLTNGDLELIVPEDCYFVLGDNRLNSLDSRSPLIGVVKKEDIIGRVFIRVFPKPSLY